MSHPIEWIAGRLKLWVQDDASPIGDDTNTTGHNWRRIFGADLPKPTACIAAVDDGDARWWLFRTAGKAGVYYCSTGFRGDEIGLVPAEVMPGDGAAT